MNSKKIVEIFQIEIEGKILEFTKYDDGSIIIAEIQ